ncbi:XRE family transcriptional regulator [Clostridium sp. AM22-16AC]|nr:XRE family transcriptional regulator [Clostridium sp. AM22-16AC]
MCNKLNKRTVIRLQYRIKEYREKLKMSQAELSEKAKVSRTIISGLESGSITVTTTETLLKIAKALGKNVSDIFFETNV